MIEEPPTVEAPVRKSSTVGRVLGILDSVAQAGRALTPTEIAAQLELPKATVHRLCTTLEEHGYLRGQLGGRGLEAGPALNRMALGILASAPLQERRRTILETLSRKIGETCNIAVPDGMQMIYFDRAETHWPVRIQLTVGSRVPAFATAGGKMYLSTLSRAHREQIIGSAHLESYTVNTIVDRRALDVELDRTAERGFSLDNQEYIDGMVALAVPVTDTRNRLYATLSFHAPCMRVPFESVTNFLPAVSAAAVELATLIDE